MKEEYVWISKLEISNKLKFMLIKKFNGVENLYNSSLDDLIDLNLKKQDIHTILGIKKYPTIINKYHKIKYYKISNKKYNIKIKNFNIIRNKKIINKIKKENKYGKIFLEEKDLDKIIKIFLFKINKNISFFSGINYLL